MRKIKIKLPLEKFCEDLASRFYEYTGYRIDKRSFKTTLLVLMYSIMMMIPVLFTVSILYELTRNAFFRYLSISLSFTLMGMFMGMIALISNALMIIYRRDTRFNEKFLYTVSYMVPLLATSAPLAEVIAKLYQVEKDPEIKHELGLILKDYILGTDIITAIKRSIERTRSIVYKDVMTALVQSVQLTTEPERIILQKLNVLVRDKFLRLRQVLTNLTLLFQTYSIMAFLAPSLLLILYAAFGLPQLLSGARIGAGAPFISTYLSMIVPPFFNVWGIAVMLAMIYSPFITIMFYMIFDSIMSVL
ncbi:MAG: hypothetical protein GXO10_01100 [Crenarchaeota archaeon]|nr:hypothetical protein [Thermoproteota archaeon]